MKRSILVILLSTSVVASFAQAKKPVTTTKVPVKPTAAVPTAALKNNIDSVSYSIGVRMAQSLKSQGFENINFAVLNKAMTDALTSKKLLVADEAINGVIGEYQQKASALKNAGVKKESQDFMALNSKKPGVITLPDGLQYQVLKAGTSDVKPALTSKVKVHYHGTLLNGTVFDSSVDKGAPITYPVNGFIAGWQEALQMMTVGSKWKLWVPSQLGYGDAGGPAPGAMLIFEMELLGIEN